MLGVFGWRLRKEQSYIPCQFQVMLKVIQTKMTRMMWSLLWCDIHGVVVCGFDQHTPLSTHGFGGYNDIWSHEPADWTHSSHIQTSVPGVVFSFLLTALGQALNDTHANTFAAKPKGAHRRLAIVHASFMGGCFIGPFVATAVASADKPSRWNRFYTFPVRLSLVIITLIGWAFRDTLKLQKVSLAAVPINENTQQAQSISRNQDALGLVRSALICPSAWLLSIFYFFYVGLQITISGWIAEYLVQVRHGDLVHMGFIPTAFNGGCLLGRLILAEPTFRLSGWRMVLIYCIIAVGLEFVFWLYVTALGNRRLVADLLSVPNIAVAAVAISLLGFITGPFFTTVSLPPLLTFT
jgi:fucose permease